MNIIEKAAQRLAEHPERRDLPPPIDGQSTLRDSTTPAGERVHAGPPHHADSTDLHAPAAHGTALPVRPIPPEDVEPDVRLINLGSNLFLSPEGGRSRTAEEFRMIKRPLLTNAFERRATHKPHPNLIMVTSALQGEGKSFTSLNLAISITMELDSTVLLVDADVAKPGLSQRLGLSDRSGLIERLVDESADLSALLLRTDIPKLTILPAGQRHKRSTELLASGTMRRLLDELANRYSDRIVLFDSPPLLETSEASVLATQMGQVVIVVESQGTSQGAVKEALAQFESTDNVYFILNKCKESIFSGKYGYGFGYGYGYGYGSSYGAYGEK